MTEPARRPYRSPRVPAGRTAARRDVAAWRPAVAWRAAAAWWVAAALVAALAGCTADAPSSSGPGAGGPARPEQRMHFVWGEAVEVEPRSRAVADAAREWEHAYHLWVSEPTSVPPYLAKHTGAALFHQIEEAAEGAPRGAGTIRVALVEAGLSGAVGTLGVCVDTRDYGILGPDGRRKPGSSGTVNGYRLRLSNTSGRWVVEDNSWASDLRARCAGLASVRPSASAAG
ncbi:MAG TPA: hypothetical protein VFM55_23755 [Micromonosporaceae bacterium]|nr:hypothetical protein [Micromonosporaceae bacterium]